MNETAKTARALLDEGNFTCVILKQSQQYTSVLRGVKPLMQYLKSGIDLTQGVAADRVVGKATAFLYVLLGVREVNAHVMSQGAQDVLQAHGIVSSCDTLVENIINRQRTGICPFEEAVLSIAAPTDALSAIEEKMHELGITL